jgi:hypothetical protein
MWKLMVTGVALLTIGSFAIVPAKAYKVEAELDFVGTVRQDTETETDFIDHEVRSVVSFRYFSRTD